MLSWGKQPNLTRGLVIGPLVPVVAFAIGLLFAWPPGSLETAFSVLFLTAEFGLPISYVVTFVLGAPAVIFLKRRGALTPMRAVALGPLVGGLLATPFFMLTSLWGEFLLVGAVAGLFCSIGFTLAAWAPNYSLKRTAADGLR